MNKMEENNEKSAINNDEYYWKNDPILSRFSFEFSKKIRINPMYHQIFHMLHEGTDEYLIIEELLKINEKLSNDLIKLSETQQPKYFIKK
jgi:hypothetical protein